MEIFEFLAARRQRVVALLLIPVIAVAITAAFSISQSERYQSSVVVEVPSNGPDTRAAQVQAAERFEQLVASPEVVEAAAGEVGVPAAELQRSLTVQREETDVEVRVALTRPGDTARRALVALTGQAARELFAVPRAERQQAIDAAQERHVQAEAELAAFEQANNATAAPTRYQEILDQQAELRRARQEARAAGRTEEADGYQALIDEYETARLALEALLPEYRALQGDINRASNQIDTAQLQADDLEAREAGLAERAATDASQADLVDATTLLVRRALAAAAVAIVLAAATLGVLEVVRPVPLAHGVGDRPDRGHTGQARDDTELADDQEPGGSSEGDGSGSPPARLPPRVEVRNDGTLVVSPG